MTMILDGFAGPRGWSEGLRLIGLDDIGVEWDPAACATAAAAGHRTIRADVCRMPLAHLAGQIEGLIMSPPCQAFSLAGKGDGRAALGELRSAIDRGDWARRYDGHEVLEVGRWAETLRPVWVACEQVPPVLPLWKAYAARWRAMGWSAWAGLLCAADYGVPQTRTRAFLLARTDGPVHPPTPTHAKGGAATLLGDLAPWVSMAEALGWPGEDQPARTLCGDRSPRWLYPDPDGTHGRTVVRTQNRQGNAAGRVDYERSVDEPSPTLVQNADRWTLRAGALANATVRTIDEPSPTVLGSWDNGDTRWELNRRQQHEGTPVRNIPSDEPAPTLTGIAGAKSQWIWERPATTVCGDPRLSFPGHHDEDHRGLSADEGSVRLTLAQALILQSFRPDYPVQGTKTKQFEQVGNAVPPLLAAHVVAAVAGLRPPIHPLVR